MVLRLQQRVGLLASGLDRLERHVVERLERDYELGSCPGSTQRPEERNANLVKITES
jgi:hypothetical protein